MITTNIIETINLVLSMRAPIPPGIDYFEPIPRFHCADGFNISIQASKYNYSRPQSNKGPYIGFELGYPSEEDELIIGWAEEMDKPTETIYPYVHAHQVELLIKKHGGLVVKF